MRFLEEVIQNKFLVRKGVNRSYILDHNHLTDDIPIYTIDNMEIDNMVDLLKLITPLLYHLISILKQERENRERHLLIKLEFIISEESLELDDIFKVKNDNVIKTIRDSIQERLDIGYYMKFIQIFNVHFLVKDNDPDSDSYESDNDPEGENFINNFLDNNININRSFKLDNCVVCIETKPNVLLCECGHICLCVSCLNAFEDKRTCPVCKNLTNTIRIL